MDIIPLLSCVNERQVSVLENRGITYLENKGVNEQLISVECGCGIITLIP